MTIKKIMGVFLAFFCTLNSAFCYAHNEMVTGVAEYEITPMEDKKSAENIAKFWALREATEQLCTVVKSSTEIQNSNLSHDIVYVASAGMIQVVDQKVEWVENNKVRVCLTAKLNDNNIQQVIDRILHDSSIVIQYKKTVDDINTINNKIEHKKKELESSKNSITENQINDDINKLSQEFLGIIWFEKALIQHVIGMDDDAFISLDTAIAIKPDYVNVYGLKGNIYYHQGNYDSALHEYNKALELDPNYSDVLHGIGLIYKNIQNYDMALKYLNKAISIDQYSVPMYNLRAVVYSSLNRFIDAEKDYEKALKLNHMDYDSLVGMSMLKQEMGNYHIAYQYAQKATELYPHSARGYMAKGIALYFMGKLNEAVDSFNNGIQYEKEYEAKELMINIRNSILDEIRARGM